jgi:hypothetical protein
MSGGMKDNVGAMLLKDDPEAIFRTDVGYNRYQATLCPRRSGAPCLYRTTIPG